MAYNKSKYVDAALKYLHQGKLAQAIGEYQQILKHEPKDQITLMTVGDLFVRQGDTFQALEYFERLASIYLADGFVTKAIAIYKKVAKLAPEESRPVEKLAELYVQQGVLSEARPIFMQLAEMHQRANRPVQAAALLRKLLDAEPDNLRAQTKLGELSLAAGLKADAAAAYCAAARQLLAKGDHAEAIKNVDRALQIERGNAAATALKVRIHAASGQQKQAIAMLEAAPDLEQGGETASLLLDLYLEQNETDKAVALASRIFARDAKQFAPALRLAKKCLEEGDGQRALTLLDTIRGAMTDAGEHEALSQAIVLLSERLPTQIEPLQWLVDLYGRSSDSFRLPDALANLAHAYEAAGDYKNALAMFEQLLDREPEKESVRRECDRLRQRMGLGGDAPAERPAEAPAAPVALAEPQPESAAEALPPGEPADEETRRFIAQALTDVDLFSSYGLTQKAMDLLENVLNRVPGHAVALERLLDLYLGAGNERRTAELAAQLEQIYKDSGNAAVAERFSELRRRFERAAPPQTEAAAPPPALTQEFSVPMVEAEPVEPAPQPAPETAEPVSAAASADESSVHEVDLSEEWAALVDQVDSAALSGNAGGISAEKAAQDAAVAATPLTASGQPTADEPEYVLELDSAPSEAKASDANARSLLDALSADLEAAVPSLLAAQPQPEAPPLPKPEPPQQSRVEAPAATNGANGTGGQAASPGPLGDVFDEFRADLGEGAAPENEDLETHYNLGIAYREMGLLEEAISEFQKVAKANNTGRAFRYAMQCCTLLGLAFMERGQPAIAAMWYERALQTPGLDQETVLALRYDLGVAQELAGDASAARKSFSQVYGMNIDYRDVGERLAALGKDR